MNQCPTIFFSMKDVDGLDFENAYQKTAGVIANLCKEHTYLLESNEIDPDDKEIFLHFKKQEMGIRVRQPWHLPH